MKRPVSYLSLLLIMVLAMGCNGSKNSKIAYTSPAPADDSFEMGAKRPPTAQTLYRMARLLAAQGKDDQAQAVLMNSMERYPSYAPTYCELAALQMRQRKFNAASVTLEKALTHSPDDAVVLNDLGMTWMLRENYDRALEFFTKAAGRDPDNARYRANMAMATAMLGRYDEAFSLYEQIMPPAQAHYNVAVVAEARKDSARANEEYAAARAMDKSMKRKSRPDDQ